VILSRSQAPSPMILLLKRILLFSFAIILIFVALNFGLLRSLFLYPGSEDTSFLEVLYYGNWIILFFTALFFTTIIYYTLLVLHKKYFENRSFYKKMILVLLVTIIGVIFCLKFFNVILGPGHWRTHCFAVCKLPADDGNLNLILSCVVAPVLYLIRSIKEKIREKERFRKEQK